jgi:hypothetical protein
MDGRLSGSNPPQPLLGPPGLATVRVYPGEDGKCRVCRATQIADTSRGGNSYPGSKATSCLTPSGRVTSREWRLFVPRKCNGRSCRASWCGIDLAPHNIQVNAIAPGWIGTDMTAPVRTMPLNDEILARTPRRSMGSTGGSCRNICVLGLAGFGLRLRRAVPYSSNQYRDRQGEPMALYVGA